MSGLLKAFITSGKKVKDIHKVTYKKGYFRKIITLSIVALFVTESSGFAIPYNSSVNSALRPLSFKNSATITPKSSSAGQNSQSELAAYNTRLAERSIWQYELGYDASLLKNSSKFFTTGEIMPFYGLTAIAWTRQQRELDNRLRRLQQELKAKIIAVLKDEKVIDTDKDINKVFFFLDPDSFHMTVCDIDPRAKKYTDARPAEPVTREQFEERLDQVGKAFKAIGTPGKISAQVKGVGLKRTITALVRFPDVEELTKVRGMEAVIKDKTQTSEREFTGHISLAYFINYPGDKAFKRIVEILKEYENIDLGEFSFSSFDFTYFPNMNHFVPILTKNLTTGEIIPRNRNYDTSTSFIKSSSSGDADQSTERIALLQDEIKEYRDSKILRNAEVVNSFLRWLMEEASLNEILGVIGILSHKGFRFIEQTEDEARRSEAEVDFRKHADQEEVALQSRIIHAITKNMRLDAESFASVVFAIDSYKKAKTSSNLFKIAVELASSKISIDSIKTPINVAFVFAIYAGRDRMSRQDEDMNGEDALRRKIRQLEDLFKDNPLINWQLIAVDDGSPNHSGEFAEDIMRDEYLDHYLSGRTRVLYLNEAIKENQSHPALRGLKSADDSQKGGAIEYGMYTAIRRGADVVIYTDTDISSHLGLAGLLLAPIYRGDADVVIGSRDAENSLVLNRPLPRKIQSWQDTKFFNRLVTRWYLPSIEDINDTQNAFKAFRRDVLDHILPFTIDKRFTFDTELLMLARGAGFKLQEVGMPWVDTPARTSVSITDGIAMRRNIIAQKRRLDSGQYNLKGSRQYDELILKHGNHLWKFLIISPLYKSKSLLLAEDENTGELFVIKKLITEEMEDHAASAMDFLDKVPEDYPHVYRPMFMTAVNQSWAGLEESQAIVYPYLTGESFLSRFHRSAGTTMGYYGLKLIDTVLKVVDVSIYLKEHDVPGIWDIRAENIIIRPNGEPMLIDYTTMRVDTMAAIEGLLWSPLRQPFDPETQTGHKDYEDVVETIRFTKSKELNDLIKERFKDFHKKVKQREFSTIEEFKEELFNLRQFIARQVLKDLIRDWQRYDQNKETIRKLTLSILGIERPEDFKPTRPVRVIIGAAGLGTRMGGDKPKVLQEVNGEPIIYHVLKETRFLDKNPIVITRPDVWRDALGNAGTGGSYVQIREALEQGGFDAEYTFQEYLKGDGYAVLSTKQLLKDFDGDVLVVWGDMAVLNPETVLWLTMMHQALDDIPLSIATAAKEHPYAPILENEQRRVVGSKKGTDMLFGRDDVGVFIGDAVSIFRSLSDFPKDAKGDFINPYDNLSNKKGEMNFVQIASMFAQEGREVIAPPIADIREFQGVNDFAELNRAQQYRNEMARERSRLNQMTGIFRRENIATLAIRQAA